MARTTSRSEFWARLSPKARLLLSIGIFTTFATIGIFHDSWTPGAPPWYWVAVQCVIAGSISLSWAYTFLWSRKFIASIVITCTASAVLGYWTSDTFPNPATPQAWFARAAWGALVCMVLVATGYIFFVKFISTEGAEQLRLRTEIDLARGIHEVLVPPVDATHGRLEVFGRSIASSEVGGDLMDVYVGDHGVIVTVADVSGHGVAAGTLMGMIKSVTRVKLMDGTKLGALAGDLNRVLFQVKGKEMFATLSALRFHSDGEVELTVAGHLPLFHIRGQSGDVDVHENEHLPLGILEDATFSTRTLRSEPGDIFVLITDGLTEVENTKGEELGWDPIRAIVTSRRTHPLSEIHAEIMRAVQSHGPQADDQTLVLARFT